MRRAVGLAVENVRLGGGPFGAVVVKDDRVVAEGCNRVTASCDPTAHAEIVAIREACRLLGCFHLQGCDIYASCEPCPMCLGAIYWARLENVFFAATRADAATAGFSDAEIYDELSIPFAERRIPMTRLLVDESARPFAEWKHKEDRVHY